MMYSMTSLFLVICVTIILGDTSSHRAIPIPGPTCANGFEELLLRKQGYEKIIQEFQDKRSAMTALSKAQNSLIDLQNTNLTCNKQTQVYTAIVYYRNSGALLCPDETVIKIKSASHTNLPWCTSQDPFAYIQQQCDNSRSCVVESKSCDYTTYLRAEYLCVALAVTTLPPQCANTSVLAQQVENAFIALQNQPSRSSKDYRDAMWKLPYTAVPFLKFDNATQICTAIICQSKRARLLCPSGTKIRVNWAQSSMDSTSICGPPSSKADTCTTANTTEFAKQRCHNYSECLLEPYLDYCGPLPGVEAPPRDPCALSYAYFMVEYSCTFPG